MEELALVDKFRFSVELLIVAYIETILRSTNY